MNKRQVAKRVKELGWKLEYNDADFRVQDSTWWWQYNCGLVSVKKDNHKIILLAVGDIKIYGKRESNHFVYKGWSPSGKLTKYLMKTGVWENNNWFEWCGDLVHGYDTVSYSLDEAMARIFEIMERYNKGGI